MPPPVVGVGEGAEGAPVVDGRAGAGRGVVVGILERRSLTTWVKNNLFFLKSSEVAPGLRFNCIFLDWGAVLGNHLPRPPYNNYRM